MKCSLLTLSRYVDSELDAQKRGQLEAHLVTCQRCSTGLQHIHDEIEQVGLLAPAHVPDDSVRSLLAEIGILAESDVLPAPPQRQDNSDTTDSSLPWLNNWEATATPSPSPPADNVDITGHQTLDIPGREMPATSSPVNTETSTPPPSVSATDQGDTPMASNSSWPPSYDDRDPDHYTGSATALADGDERVDESVMPSFSRPVPGGRPGLMQRIRERMEVRRALRQGAGSHFDDVEIVRGAGAPPRTRAEGYRISSALGPAPNASAGMSYSDLRRNALIRPDQRPVLIAGGVVAVLLIIGLASGKSTKPLNPPSTAAVHAQPAVVAPHSNAPAPKVSVQPAAPAASAPAAPAQPPSAAPSVNSGQSTVGTGGNGYTIAGIRYGEHPNDFRIVFDLTGSASATGEPKVTTSMTDPTTLLVAFEGAAPGSATTQPPTGQLVTAVSLMSPAPLPGTVYQLKLAHTAQVSAGYVPDPLRLAIDLQ